VVPRELYLFFLTNKLGHSYYVENGLVKSRLTPTWLPESPDGWMDTEISFARNAKYFGLNRSFTNPLKFVGDGAQILRYLFWTGKGVEQEVYLCVNKWNDQTGIYDPYYKGQVDLSKKNDEVDTWYTVNLLESGLLQILKANENNVIEIPCNGSIPENKLISIDGILFQGKYSYIIPQIDFEDSSADNCITVPLAFVNAEGDAIGIKRGEPNYEQFNEGTVVSYVGSSSNYLFESIAAIQVKAAGKLKFTITDVFPSVDTKLGDIDFYYLTSKTATFPNLTNRIYHLRDGSQSNTYEVDLSATLNLAADERLYFVIRLSANAARKLTIHIQESNFSLSFDSRYKTTTSWGITWEDAYKYVVDKMTDGKYQGVSTLLASYKNLMLTSGMSLRNSTDSQGNLNAVIKTSLADLFTSANAVLNTSLGNEKTQTGSGEQLFLEKKMHSFDSSSVTLSLGEVSKLSILVAEDKFFNNLKIGYPEQKYDEKQGNLEYNTTSQYNPPVLKFTKDLQLISKYRADSYGVEYTRYLTPGNNTVNNKSDNDVFILNTEEVVSAINAVSVFIDASAAPNYYFSIAGASNPLFSPGQKFTVSGTISNNKTFTVKAIQLGVNIYNVIVYEPVVTEISDASFTFSALKLLRETYTSVSGLVNSDTAYNIKDLTPGRMVRAHGNYLRGVLHNQVNESLKFLSTDKNKDLSTTINGVTIIEKADIPISILDKPLFYPYLFKFRTEVPITFEQVMTGAANGHIHFTYNGVSLYGFPIEVSVKPTLNDVQEWTLLVSPMTKLSDLIDLDINGLNFINAMGYSIFVPHLCPVKFVPLGTTLPAQYHFRQMDEWWFSEQIQMYLHQPKYFAKWQKNDLIKLQFQTNGLGPVQVEILNAKGEVQDTIAITNVSDPAIILPQILYEGNIDLSALEEGVYYLHLTAGVGDDAAEMISEPFEVKEDWPDTLLIEYSNKKNKLATVFSTGYNPSFRVEGWIDNFKPEATFSTYVNQPADIEILNGIPYRTFKLNIGFDQGHPDWVFDKVNRISLLNKVLYDGQQFSRDADAKWEAINIPGSPLKFSSIQIRPSKNREGISQANDGSGINSGTALTVVYNIDTAAFGDGAGSSNVVHVTKVDD
jgi:hypothetical protein